MYELLKSITLKSQPSPVPRRTWFRAVDLTNEVVVSILASLMSHTSSAAFADSGPRARRVVCHSEPKSRLGSDSQAVMLCV